MLTETRREKFVGRFLKFVSIVDLFRSAQKLLPCAELLFLCCLPWKIACAVVPGCGKPPYAELSPSQLDKATAV